MQEYKIYNAKKNPFVAMDSSFKRIHPITKDSFIIDQETFDKYKENGDCQCNIIGQINYNQMFYLKPNKAAIGVAEFNGKKYDVYEYTTNRIYGYAWLGQDDFIVVNKPSIYFLFPIVVILCLLLAFLLCSCPNGNLIDIANDVDIIHTTQNEDITEKPLCYFAPFNETTVLTKSNKNIDLMNVSANKDNYYISYKLYVNGNVICDDNGNDYSTGCIAPAKQVSYPLWDKLDKGEYELTVVATEYDYEALQKALNTKSAILRTKLEEEAKMPTPTKLTTKLIIDKEN